MQKMYEWEDGVYTLSEICEDVDMSDLHHLRAIAKALCIVNPYTVGTEVDNVGTEVDNLRHVIKQHINDSANLSDSLDLMMEVIPDGVPRPVHRVILNTDGLHNARLALRNMHDNLKKFVGNYAPIPQDIDQELVIRALMKLYSPSMGNAGKATGKPVVQSNALHRTQLLNFLQRLEGHFVGITYTKNNGEQRKLNGRLGVVSYGDISANRVEHESLPYMTIFDVKKMDWRTVRLDTVETVRCENEYTIVD